MRRYLVLSLMALAGWASLAGSGPAPARAQPPNLLRNPGFEGAFSAWNGINEVQMAAEWTPWWVEDPNHNPAWFRPEYKRAVAAIYPNRVLGGQSAQQYFTFYASHVAGMYQQVFGVTPGQRYQFSIWAQVWSSESDDPLTSVAPANPHLKVGIDPTGQWNPFAPGVVWSFEASMAQIIDRWGFVSVEAVAQADVITVFVYTNPDFAVKHNDMYWDNAGLFAVAPPPPTAPPPTDTPPPPPPTATPGPPTATSPPPPPTNTPPPPPPTNTLPPPSPPPPTNTPPPPPPATPTATPSPTPTATATALPSLTPSPTATATPPPTIDAAATAQAFQAATQVAAVNATAASSAATAAAPAPPTTTPAAASTSVAGLNTNAALVMLAGTVLLLMTLIILILVWRRVGT